MSPDSNDGLTNISHLSRSFYKVTLTLVHREMDLKFCLVLLEWHPFGTQPTCCEKVKHTHGWATSRGSTTSYSWGISQYLGSADRHMSQQALRWFQRKADNEWGEMRCNADLWVKQMLWLFSVIDLGRFLFVCLFLRQP